MSACCNSVNKSNLQFSGRDVYLQTERLRSLAQFLKHVIIPQKRQVFTSIRKLLTEGSRTKATGKAKIVATQAAF